VAAPTKEIALQQMRSGQRALTRDTICGVHRTLWGYVMQLPEPQRSEAEDLLADAYLMGSKMHFKLREYKSRS
jgi:hypothetical protein